MKNIVFVNTHLDHVGKKARANSASLIKERLGRMLNELPLVVTGDFNVDNTSNVYATITGNEFVLNDSRCVTDSVEGDDYTWHDFGKLPANEREKIDFIFVTPSIKVTHAFIPQEDVNALLSDHNPHIATLQF